MVGRALYRIADVLLAILFVALVYAGFFSTAVFLCEAGSWSDTAQAYVRPGEAIASPFASLPHTIWWAASTLFAMGYGGKTRHAARQRLLSCSTVTGIPLIPADLVPTTPCGKTVGTIAMVAGTLVLALLFAVVVASFGLVCCDVAGHEPPSSSSWCLPYFTLPGVQCEFGTAPTSYGCCITI